MFYATRNHRKIFMIFLNLFQYHPLLSFIKAYGSLVYCSDCHFNIAFGQ